MHSNNIQRPKFRGREREIYSIINRVSPETTNDWVKANCFDSKIFKLLQESFPSTVGFYKASKASRNYIHFSTLVKPYVLRNSTSGTVIQGVGKEKFVEMVKELGDEDHRRMKEFMRFFKRIFGDPSTSNLFSEYHKITVIARIYYTEIAGGIGEEDLEKRFSYLLKIRPQLFMGTIHHYQEQIDWYYDIIRALNTVRKWGRKDVANMLELGKIQPNNKV